LAMEHVAEACRRATKRTGALCHTIKARILSEQHDRRGTIEAYSTAVDYDPDDVILRHQYGVALSQAGHEAEAVKQFSIIIDAEKARVPPRETLLIALTTRIINLKRLGLRKEAQSDLAFARRILESNVHLQPPAIQLRELLDDEN
jgi:cytochrome c-type biogenesis protein CcmH/NrfG